MARSYSVTSAGLSAAEDRAHRMRFYFVAMSLRVVCVASMFFVRSWWAILCIVGAVILPYLAVMVGNAIGPATDGQKPDAPTPPELLPPEQQPDADRPSGRTIVIDADVHRRADRSGDDGSDTPGTQT